MRTELATIREFFSLLLKRFGSSQEAYEYYRIPRTVYRKMRAGKLRPPPGLLAQWQREFPALGSSRAFEKLQSAPLPARLLIRESRCAQGLSLDDARRRAGLQRHAWVQAESSSCPELPVARDSGEEMGKMAENLLALPQQILTAAKTLALDIGKAPLAVFNDLADLSEQYSAKRGGKRGVGELSKGKARKSSDAASQLMAIWHKVWETEIYGIDYYARLREDLVRSRKPKSLRTIGKEVGTSHAFIQKLEEGQRPLPSGPTLVTILRAIGMDEREIFDTVASRLIDPREAIGLATGEVMLLEATQVSGLDVVHFPGTLQTGQSPKFHLLGGVNPRAIEFGAYAIPTWANDQSPSRGDNSACAAALEKGSVPSRHGKSVPSARPAESDLARTDMGKEIAEDGMKYDECIEIDDAGRNVVEDETMTVPKWAQMPIELD